MSADKLKFWIKGQPAAKGAASPDKMKYWIRGRAVVLLSGSGGGGSAAGNLIAFLIH